MNESTHPQHASGADLPVVEDELELLASLVPLDGASVVEAGCGNAALARKLLARYPRAQVVGLEVDRRQHAKNLGAPQAGLRFVEGGAQAIPFPDASFDGALMLKSLHHVPLPSMADALAELARVLKPGGWFYASEPVYGGEMNELVKLFNDERVVREAAQRALDAALASGRWRQEAERMFVVPRRFASFADFERRLMHPTFADRQVDAATLEATRILFERHAGPQGATLRQSTHVRLLRRA
jgi:ubiquinone/menaquinone biosynthesis C-methylase UbiE